MPRKNERNENQKLTYPQLLGQAVCLENSLPKARDLKHPARWPPTQPHFDTLSRRCHWQFAFSFVVIHCYIHCCSLLDSFNSFILVYFMTVHTYIITHISTYTSVPFFVIQQPFGAVCFVMPRNHTGHKIHSTLKIARGDDFSMTLPGTTSVAPAAHIPTHMWFP